MFERLEPWATSFEIFDTLPKLIRDIKFVCIKEKDDSISFLGEFCIYALQFLTYHSFPNNSSAK